MESLRNQRIDHAIGFPVVFTHDVFSRENSTLERLFRQLKPVPSEKPSRILFILDSGVQSSWPGLVEKIFQKIEQVAGLEISGEVRVIPGGEICKSDRRYLEEILEWIAGAGLDRHSYVAAIGGGALLDLVGFAASISHRGIRLLRFPTTVLSQNDSAVGIKNGINAFGQKNYLGSFAAPAGVVGDLDFIKTLPEKDLRTGVSEALKVSLIRDSDFFSWIGSHAIELANADPIAMDEMIQRSAHLHMDHIATSGDPFEEGSARPLDFGHWSAHKMEVLSNHRLGHGEAVAIGMGIDLRYSLLTGLISHNDYTTIQDVIRRLSLPRSHPIMTERDPDGTLALLRGLEEFRTHLGGELTLIQIRRPGEPVEIHQVDQRIMERAIIELAGENQNSGPGDGSLS